MGSVSGARSRWSRSAWALTLALLLCRPASTWAQSSANLLLVVNDASPASIQIGDYYAGKRQVPADHIVHLRTPAQETVTRPEYAKAIEAPIADWLTRHSLQDEVLYLVLTKGVPIRVAGTGGLEGTNASVDS